MATTPTRIPPLLAVVLGALVGLAAGYFFFHDEGDGFLAGWLPALFLAAAGAGVGYFMVKPNRAGPRP